MTPASQTHPILQDFAEDAQTHRAHVSDVDDLAVAETRRAEVHGLAFAGRDEVFARGGVREVGEHEVLEETGVGGGVGEGGVNSACSVGGLLEESGRAGEFEDVDWDRQALAGEDGVHERDILACEVAGDGEDEDSAGEGEGGVGAGGGVGEVVAAGDGVGVGVVEVAGATGAGGGGGESLFGDVG